MVDPGSCMRLLVSASLLAVATTDAVGQNVIDRQYEIKAVYLYQFGRHVRWPAAEGEHFVIGVLGNDPFGAVLRTIERSKTVGGKKVVVHRFRSMADYTPCHILFISPVAAEGVTEESAEERLQAALEKTRGSPVLLVSDIQGFSRKGVVINFVVDARANVVRLEINEDAEERAGVKIAAALKGLKVVTLVHDR